MWSDPRKRRVLGGKRPPHLPSASASRFPGQRRLPRSLAAAWRGFGAGSGGVVKFLAPPCGRCNPTFRMTDQSRCAPRSELPGSAGGLRTWYLLL